MQKLTGSARPRAGVASSTQHRGGVAPKTRKQIEAELFYPCNLPPFDRESVLEKWLEAFEQYARAYEICRLDRHQAAAFAANEKAASGRPVQEQAERFEDSACRLVLASKFLDDACARLEFINSTSTAAI